MNNMKKYLLLLLMAFVSLFSVNAEKIDYKHTTEYNRIGYLYFSGDYESANCILCTNQTNQHYISVNLKPNVWNAIKNQLKDNGDLTIELENGFVFTLKFATKINAFKENTGEKTAGFYNGRLYYTNVKFKPHSLIYPLTQEQYDIIKNYLKEYAEKLGTTIGAVKLRFNDIKL